MSGMKPSYHVNFGDAYLKPLQNPAHNIINGKFKTSFFPFFSGEGTKFTFDGADIGIIDMAINNVVGFVAMQCFSHLICKFSERDEIVKIKKGQGFVRSNAFLLRYFFLYILKNLPTCLHD